MTPIELDRLEKEANEQRTNSYQDVLELVAHIRTLNREVDDFKSGFRSAWTRAEAAEKERDAWRDENRLLAGRVIRLQERAELAEKRLAILTEAAQDYVDREIRENQHRLVDALASINGPHVIHPLVRELAEYVLHWQASGVEPAGAVDAAVVALANAAPLCRACGAPLIESNRLVADGCPCNSGRGINHGIVDKDACTCVECDPAQTGGSRVPIDEAKR